MHSVYRISKTYILLSYYYISMPKKIVSFTLSKESIEKIDKTSKALGVSRSELIEFMIEKGFHFSKDVQTAINKISELQESTKAKIKNRRS